MIITECKNCIGNSLKEFLENKTKLIIDGFEPHSEMQKCTQVHHDLTMNTESEYTTYIQIFVKTIAKVAT